MIVVKTPAPGYRISLDERSRFAVAPIFVNNDTDDCLWVHFSHPEVSAGGSVQVRQEYSSELNQPYHFAWPRTANVFWYYLGYMELKLGEPWLAPGTGWRGLAEFAVKVWNKEPAAPPFSGGAEEQLMLEEHRVELDLQLGPELPPLIGRGVRKMSSARIEYAPEIEAECCVELHRRGFPPHLGFPL
jgi:hypothetical protein